MMHFMIGRMQQLGMSVRSAFLEQLFRGKVPRTFEGCYSCARERAAEVRCSR